MDRDIYQEACPVSPSMVSPRRIARDQPPATATGTAKDGLKETSGQEDYIPGVGMRSAGQSQLDSQVLPSAKLKAMPVLAIILNCCLLGTVIFIAVTVSDLKLSVNKLDQKTLNLQLSVRQINQQAEKSTTGQAVVSTWPRQVTEKAEDLTVTVDDETTMQTVSAATCPDGYMKYREVCYKAFDTYKTFSESADICRSDGGTLAMPRDAGVNAFLYSLTTTLGSNDDFWFGLHDQFFFALFVYPCTTFC
uniref:C-type lectin domain-containing protein n=1 Tax=Branchiostoma floridae TaxID=7739 RepID=C3XQN0_BRAFL|eukprot:XP_002613597.1 hypothetical protein BRAFLDRAFT_93640 [Branchiostoma floridae]